MDFSFHSDIPQRHVVRPSKESPDALDFSFHSDEHSQRLQRVFQPGSFLYEGCNSNSWFMSFSFPVCLVNTWCSFSACSVTWTNLYGGYFCWKNMYCMKVISVCIYLYSLLTDVLHAFLYIEDFWSHTKDYIEIFLMALHLSSLWTFWSQNFEYLSILNLSSNNCKLCQIWEANSQSQKK